MQVSTLYSGGVMMKETKPLMLLERYRSVLISAIIVEIVTFIVSLTDSLVAANRIGTDALSSVGLFSPFFSLSTFMTAIVNSGTMMLFSTAIGRYNKQRAAELFSQGCIMAVVSGILLTAIVYHNKTSFPFIVEYHTGDQIISDQLLQRCNTIFLICSDQLSAGQCCGIRRGRKVFRRRQYPADNWKCSAIFPIVKAFWYRGDRCRNSWLQGGFCFADQCVVLHKEKHFEICTALFMERFEKYVG